MGETIKIGDRVYDSVTGFRGTVTSRIESMGASDRCQVTEPNPKADGSLRNPEWFDAGRLIRLDASPA